MRSRHKLACVFAGAVAFAACERVGTGYSNPGTVPSDSPSAVASTAPGSCLTSPTASVLIGMSSGFGEYADPVYGELAGYADVTTAEPGLAGTVSATTADTVQFVNLEASSTDHSAVGFPAVTSGSGFPAVPYTFPAVAASPSANAAIGATAWSTGRILPATTDPCYSQAFTLPKAGTYYFGDLDFYNTITSLRDVIVVTTATSNLRPRSHRSK
jgi:hypothetical protein